MKAEFAEHCKAMLDLLEQVNKEHKRFPKGFLEPFTIGCVQYAYLMKKFDNKFPEGVQITIGIQEGEREWQKS